MQRSSSPSNFSARSAGPCTEMPTPSPCQLAWISIRSTSIAARLSAVARTMPDRPAPTISTRMRRLKHRRADKISNRRHHQRRAGEYTSVQRLLTQDGARDDGDQRVASDDRRYERYRSDAQCGVHEQHGGAIEHTSEREPGDGPLRQWSLRAADAVGGEHDAGRYGIAEEARGEWIRP